jgi:MFS family permease
VIALAIWKLKEPERKGHPRPFDISGAILFASGLSALLVAMTLGNKLGWSSPQLLMLLTFTTGAFLGFVLVERKKGSDAMLDLQLFTRNRLFAAANVSALLNYTSYFGVSFLLSFYMQRVLEYSLLLTSMVLLSMPLVMSLLSPLMGWASDRLGSRALASGGMVLMGIGLLLLTTIGETTSTTELVAFLVVLGVGMGMFSSPNTSAIMGCVAKGHLGVASGTLATMRTVGQSLSLAIMIALVAVVASPGVISELFLGAGTASSFVSQEFIDGMSLAFMVSAIIAFVGAITSLARGGAQDCGARSMIR